MSGRASEVAPARTARLIAVSTGVPKDVPWEGGTVRTSIFRTPRDGPVVVRATGLEGDEVANPAVHGGPTKTIYAYPAEHYPFWSSELGGVPLPWGSFGENLTTEGLVEAELRAGDLLSIGTAQLVVTRPRGPCFKLNVRFGRTDVLPRFLAADRPGFYLGVVTPGTISAGDTVGVTRGTATGPTIVDMFRARSAERA
jgi:MOSC domain-containing protein YiiM